ncbi:M20 aminoacylase family protein [Pseudodonghicola flavimaris]|uniref:M20 aminoacylase family protein n=1 Tax=Pseudodonghicola flavimaris TaxID=3050036 RepID=A0ABT7F7B7_9RHOB|nr:M20 aminoacylase family protein [Pseudodonghicola flavimaris]MDK3020481.1 M20 aminoacylase family protein [Pseudodonghicola flavimaris]
MPVLNRAAELQDEIAGWRQQIHMTPELLFDVETTAALVADKLKEFGVDEIVTGLGRTGVVGIVNGSGSGPTIGLRADMDALPIEEQTGKPYASQVPGKMHACGHDGHTAMLLGAAKYLAETRNFAGRVALIFQPAEEGGGGGKVMVDDGLMERFDIAEVYGMHNYPGLPVGTFAIRKGPMMASADQFEITITGLGGHAATPQRCIDPVVIGGQIIGALQTIASRNVDPLDSVVVTIGELSAGTAHNIIPEVAVMRGTVRTLRPETRDLAETRIRQICDGIAAANGGSAVVDYDRMYPVTSNHAAETDHAIAAARTISGEAAVITELPPVMGGEDFSFMLEARPGAFIAIGNGDSATLHHPAYDFDDAAIPFGVSYWVKLAESRLPR